jgi:exosome complex RNA-binding protein Csl4
MATGEKTTKKRTKVASTKKPVTRKLTKKSVAPKKNFTKTKPASRKTASVLTKQVRRKSQSVDTVAFAPEGAGARSGDQAGVLQGLSDVQGADSESVDELLEEGNAFEADVVNGVQDAQDADEREVHTHEVPQDDVPDEYRGKR